MKSRSSADPASGRNPPSDPARWSDGGGAPAGSPLGGPGGDRDRDTLEDDPDRRPAATVGRLFQHARQATEPSPEAVARVGRLLGRKTRAPGARGSIAWRLVVAVALLMVFAGAVGAALYHWGRSAVRATEGPARAGDGAGRIPGDAGRKRLRRGVAAGTEMPALATDAPVPKLSPAAIPEESAPAAVGAPLPSPAPQGPAGEDRQPGGAQAAVASAHARNEASMLGEAFRQLRSGGDARAALRWLDAYDRRFPGGQLRGEARVARAEALIALDRRAEALPVLEGLRDDDGGGLTRYVRLTRAELLSEAGRCQSARHDLDVVIATGAGDAVGGRALYFRAACQLRAGALGPAREDLERYLSLHPGGDLSAAARRAIEALP